MSSVFVISATGRNASAADVPTPPPKLTVTSLKDKSVTLSWTAPRSTGGLPVLYYTVLKDGNIAGRTASRAFVLGALVPDSMVSVTVQACNAVGCSDDSESAIVTTKPAPATALKAIAGNAQVTVSWIESQTIGVGEHSLWYRPSTTSVWTEWTPGVPDVTGTVITDLTNGVTYVIRIRSAATDGSAESTTAVATPLDVPDIPSLSYTKISPTAVVLEWTWPSVKWKTPHHFDVFKDGIKILRTTGRYQAVGRLTPLQEYTFEVSACNAAGCSGRSPQLNLTLPPPPATRLSVVPAVNQLTLAWVNSPTAAYHTVWFKREGALTWTEVTPGNTDTTPTVISGLQGGSPYLLRVAAHNSRGIASYAQVSAMPIGAPSPPAFMSQTAATATSVTVNWAAAQSGGSAVTSNRVYVNDVLSTTTTGKVNSATITGLQQGTGYPVTFEACNVVGCSVRSVVLTAYTSPHGVQNLAVTPAATSAVVVWDENPVMVATGARLLGHRVFYREPGKSMWLQISSSSFDVSGVALRGLKVQTNYEAFVRTYNTVGHSDSAAIPFTTTYFLPPSPPQTVGAAAGVTSARVSWTVPASTGQTLITNYIVEYSTDNGATWQVAPKPISTALNATITGLTFGVEHLFRVSAMNIAGISDPQQAANGVVPYGAPQAPTDLAAVSGIASLTLTWVAPIDTGGSPLTDYLVQYSTNGTTWSTFSDGISTNTSTTVVGLTNGTRYHFRVAASNAGGTGAFATLVGTVSPLAPPDAPTRVTGAPGDSRIATSWSRPASSGGSPVLDYEIQISSDNGATWVTFADAVSTATTAAITSLSNGTAYVVRVATVSAVGTSAFSAPSTPVTPRTVPSAPATPVAIEGVARATVTWEAPASNGGNPISDYLVQYSSNNGTTWTTFPDGLSASLSATVSGLVNGTAYVFRVAAVNGAGAGPASLASNTVTPRTVPGVPKPFGGAPGASAAILAWAAPPTGGSPITDYVVQYSSTGGTSWESFADGTGTSTSVTVTGLTNGNTYLFRVAASNAAGTGAFTAPVTILVDPALSAVTNIAGLPRSEAVALTWSAPVNAGAPVLDYVVEYSDDNGTAWQVFQDGVSSLRAFTVSGLTNMTPYLFRVSPVTVYGVGAAAVGGPFTPHTAAGPPVDLAAEPGNQTAALTWTAPIDLSGFPVTRYVISRSTSSSSTWTTIATLGTSATSHLVTGLTNGINYTFRVQSDNGAGGATATATATPGTTPSAPANVTGVVSGGVVSVSWTAPASNGGYAISNYVVQHSSDAGASWTTVTRATSTQLNASVSGLTASQTYVFRVAAQNGRGTGDYSLPSAPVVAKSVPGVPMNVVGAPGAGSVSLTWLAPSDTGGYSISNYAVQYSTNSGTSWITVNKAASNATSLTVTGLTNGVAYVFRVDAVNAAGTGASSDSSSPVTPRTIPSAVRTPTAVAGPASAQLTWLEPLANGGAPLTDYVLQYSSTSGTSWTTFNDGISTSLNASVTGLTNGTSYIFRVAAANAAGNGPWTITSSATPVSVPDAPTNLATTPGIGMIAVAWSAPASNGGLPILDYTLDVSSDGGVTWTTVNDGISSATPASVSGLDAGVAYVFRVSAVNALGAGAFSATSAPAFTQTIPGAVRDLAATAGDSSVSLTWTVPASDGGLPILDYLVEYSTDGTTWTRFVDGVRTNVFAVVTGLSNGTSYQTRVAAVNAAGTGPWVPAPATTPRTSPSAPLSVTAVAGNASASITWSAPAWDGGSAVTDYLVQHSSDDGATWTTFSDLVSTSTTATVTGLANGTSYVFRVAASNAAGAGTFSASSNSVTPFTTPDAPATVTGTPGNGAVTLTWTAPFNGGCTVTDYVVELSTDSGSSWSAFSDGISTSTSAAVTPLTNGTSYVFRVAAVNCAGTGAWSPPSAPVTPVPEYTTGALDAAFNVGNDHGGINGTAVYATALQPDGKIVAAGLFSAFNTSVTGNIARLNADGSLDASFNTGAGANGVIRSLALQSDGKVLIGGSFTSFNGTARAGIARLNADGSLDTSFAPGTGTTGSSATVFSLAVLGSGNVLIAGSFTSYNGTARVNIARLSPNGTLDTSFATTANLNGTVNSVAVGSGGKLVLGGAFTLYGTTSRNRIARLHSDGSLDSTFDPATGASAEVKSVAVHSDDTIVIGGSFTSFNGTARGRVARLTATGQLDAAFSSGAGADTTVESVLIMGDGSVLVGGQFTTFDNLLRWRLVKLTSAGALDPSFAASTGFNAAVSSITVQGNGKIVAAGSFTSSGSVGAHRVARLNADGTHDAGFLTATGATGAMNAVAVQPDGKILIGGTAVTYFGDNRVRLVRLNADGSADPAFNVGTGPDAAVNALVVQPDGKILIAGSFTSYNGSAVGRIARVNSDGSLDASFNSAVGANNVINAIALHADGKILIGGNFTSYDGTSQNRIARLNANGSLDTSFFTGSGAPTTVAAVLALPDGKAVAAGQFTTFNGATRRYIVRLNSDGSIDNTFGTATGSGSGITSMLLLPDGKIIIGGSFNTYEGYAQNRVVRVNTDGTADTTFNVGVGAQGTVNTFALQADGMILVGGVFPLFNGWARMGIARIRANGSLDRTGFNPGTGTGSTSFGVNGIATQPDGKAIAVGGFSSMNGTVRSYVARFGVPTIALRPTLTTATASTSSVDLTWSAPVEPGAAPITSYTVRYRQGSDPWTTVAVAGTSTTVSSLASGTWQFQVAAVTAQGTGWWSASRFAGTGMTAQYPSVVFEANGTPQSFLPTVSGANSPTFALSGMLPAGVTFSSTSGAISTTGLAASSTGAVDSDWSVERPGTTQTHGANNSVHATLIQPDGKVLVAGSFTTVNGSAQGRIARLNAHGTVDATFANGLAGADNTIRALALQPDGKIIIGGSFTTIHGVARGRVARLNADGSLDTSFANGMTGVDGDVHSLVLQSDGKIVIGGSFTTVNGETRGRIARLNSDGSADTTFAVVTTAGSWNVINAVGIQSDGKVVIGGAFLTINGVSRTRVARLNTNGTLDTAFGNGLAGASNTVQALAVQPDDKIVIGGWPTSLNGVARNFIGRLNADGTTDTTFGNGLAGANTTVYSMALQPDGKVLIGGDFTLVNGVSRGKLARLNTDGTLDTSFGDGLAGTTSTVRAFAVQADGRIVVGGDFTVLHSTNRMRVTRLNVTGTIDTSFGDGPAGPDSTVRSVVIQSDGKTIIGGAFTYVNGIARGYVARLNADGSLDTSFGNGLSGANGTVFSTTLQPDGKTIIGGSFTSVNGIARGNIARLNSDGSLDTSFGNGLSGANGAVVSTTLQPDGKAVIAGFFTDLNGTAAGRVARLNTDGSLDTSFNTGTGTNGAIRSLALQSDGKILIGGQFMSVNGIARGYVARLNTDGSLDTSFNTGTGTNVSVWSIALQSDGKIIIGGGFTSVNGIARGYIARLNADGSLDTSFSNGLSGANGGVYSTTLQPDGKIIIGGQFTSVNGTAAGRVARLNTDGSLDMSFGNGLSGANGIVWATTLQPDGKIIIGGQFTSVNGVNRSNVARLEAAPPPAFSVTVTVADGDRWLEVPVAVTINAAQGLNPVTNLSESAAAASFTQAWTAPAANSMIAGDDLTEHSTDIMGGRLVNDGPPGTESAAITDLAPTTSSYSGGTAPAASISSAGTPLSQHLTHHHDPAAPQ